MGCGEHKLYTALHTDNREHADGNVYVISANLVNEAAIEARTDLFGDRIDTHTAITEFARTFYELTVEADRLCNLNYNGRKSGFGIATKLVLIEAEAVFLGIGGEHRNVLFASVKNNLFIESTKSFNLVHSAAAHTSFESYAEIVADRNLIEASVKGDGFDIYISVYNFYAFASYGACLIDNFLRRVTKVDTDIFETILIACGIEDLIYADAAELILFTAKPSERAVSFNHYCSSLSYSAIRAFKYKLIGEPNVYSGG